ncbi:MAG: S9 family peptidase [Paramuribaculum sp.]|nr:S9 family peptidase [Paramuribaculum sp.]
MNIIFKSIISLASVLAVSITANAAGLSQFSDIEKYLGSKRYASAPKAFTYMNSGANYLKLSADGKKILKFDTKTGNEVETILDLGNTRETSLDKISGFKMSPEESKILVWRNSKSIYRRSFDAEYYVYELRTRLLRPLSTEHPRQQAPLFSPDGRMIAFVAQNNIYLKQLDFWTERVVTTDGAKNMIINGVPDWTYEEEFTTSSSMAWAPDNSTLCYIKYNESAVPMFSFPLYEGVCNRLDEYSLYPGAFTYKYPVAGEKNSTVSVHAYDIDNKTTKTVSLPQNGFEYIPRIAYAYSPDRLMVTTLNRAQTRMELFSVNPKSTVAKSILVEEYKAWLAPATYEDIKYFPDFFVITSSRSGYDHLYQYSYTGTLMKQITSGEYDVLSYYGYDKVSGTHYYQSTVNGAVNRVVSSINSKGKVTDISPATGCASATFSPDMTFFTLRYSNTKTPPEYTLYSADKLKKIKTLEDNARLKNDYAGVPQREFFTMTSEGVTLNGYMVKPADFNPSAKYPVVMYQYSGPGSQQVLDEWSIGWANWYAANGYIIICVDGRGTGGRGRQFMDVVYKNLGHYESIDQVNAALYAASLPYVDSKRIGIHGWSYGGYETLMASSQLNAPYAAAVAVAPVTDWRYYDTVYAERYMLTPQENEDGYRNSAPLNYVKNVKCPLLIMSGTADDNVHYFNTVQYVSAAEAADMWCDMLVFANMDHSINDCGAQKIVYARMLDYFNKNMK